MTPTSPLRRSLVVTCAAALWLGACGTSSERHDASLDAWRRLSAAREGAAADDVAPAGDARPSDTSPAGADEPAPRDLDELLAVADRRNPGVLAAAHRWRAALERVPQMGALPDPRLSLGYFLDEVETRTGPMDWRVGISQPFPWPGTLGLAEEVAAHRADAARALFEAARVEVAARVRDAWHEMVYVEAAVRVTAGHLDLVATWESVAQTRYATGLGSEADVLRAQVELGKLDDRLRTMEDLRRPLRVRINGLLDRAPDAPLPAPTPEDTSHGDRSAGDDLDDVALVASLPRTSPRLRALEAELVAAQHGIDLAEKRGWPDLAVGLDYTSIGSARASGVRGSGDDALAVTLGIGLPLQRGRIRAAEDEARAGHAAAAAAWRDARNTLVADLHLALYRLRDAERRLGLYHDTLVAKGEESVLTTDTAYRADEAGFLDLVDAERVLLEFQLAAARAEADRAQALAEIERLVGAPPFPEDGP